MVAGEMATNAADVHGVSECHQNHAAQGQPVDMFFMGGEQVVGHHAQPDGADAGHQPGSVALETLPQTNHGQRQGEQQQAPMEVLLLQPVHAQQRRHGQQQRQTHAVHHTNGGHDDGSGVDAIETLHVVRLARWQWTGRQHRRCGASYNITRRWAATVLALAATISAGCSGLSPVGDPAHRALGEPDLDCHVLRADLDSRIRRAGVIDPRHARVELSPWLRSDRFLADALTKQFRDGGAMRPILETMAAHDAAATARELHGLGLTDALDTLAALDACRQRAVEDLLSLPDGSQRMAETRVPDAYQSWQRFLGGYVLARPWLRLGAQRWRLGEHRLQRQQEPPPALLRWAGPAAADAPGVAQVSAWLAQARAGHDLNWPMPDPARLERMALLYAPVLESHSAAHADRIGQLVGRRGRPDVDTAVPVAYFEPSLVRFGEQVLLQLSYTFWFPERVARGPLDPYAGPIDGLVWRVTLNDDGLPLLWESIHACGCYYTLVLPADGHLRFHNPEPAAREDPLVLIGPPATADMRFHVSSGDHFLRWPRAAETQAGEEVTETRRYALRPYADLLEAGPDRPPFGHDGLLAGTSRLERFFLWPAGIADAGAMRSHGHHATAFLGRRHFDDPELASGMVAPYEGASP